ncbi:hypothetical protein Fmac_015361 [Flemingia macrophylla]|uniref:Apyrase 7 n=1 Tax=Flemingia macrophylla TaxID=520843 RepID=A0ABD1MED0_9FABA
MVFGKQLPGAKTNTSLRVSASLQDLSSYRHHIDPENASFSKSKPTQLPAAALRRGRCIAPIIIIIIIIIILLPLFYTLYSRSHASAKYYVVLDCGSTGTRVYVYKAQIQRRPNTDLPIAIHSLKDNLPAAAGRAYDRMETEPGLDKLLRDATAVKSALKPLLKWSLKQIPRASHKTTSLFLYATAGVRRLPFDDSKWLLDAAWNVLRASPFVCRRDWVKIISGTEEAYFGWIALNYESGILGLKPRKPTFGALDLGGSSLQVTFEGSGKQQLNSETSLYVRIGSVNHHLTAYSLAGYGLNEAFDKSVARVFKESSGSLVSGNAVVKHPCLQAGYSDRYACSHCSALDAGKGESPRVEETFLGNKGEGRTVVALVGAPDWQKCTALAKVAVNLSEWSDARSPGMDCEVHPCALHDNFPRPLGHFYVISGFFVVYRFFNLTSEATLEDVLEKGREFCEKRWSVAKKSVAPQPFIEQYCFRAPYVASLLREGLHITDKHITVGSGSITWTLGVALLAAGKSYSVRFGFQGFDLLQMKINPVVLIPILILSLILLLCALSWVVNWMPRFFRRQYLPFFRHNGGSSASAINIPSPFRFQRWSPINAGDGKIKTPLSPTVAGSQERPFSLGHGLADSSGNIQLMESPFFPSATSVSHSYSSNNLGQMQFDNSSLGSFWSPHRSKMRLQSRRSQSREDLNSSLAETHMVKV